MRIGRSSSSLLIDSLRISPGLALRDDGALARNVVSSEKWNYMIAQNTKRILILGGGFGGLYTALGLEKALARDASVEITLVNRENFFLFTPMLHEIAASDLDFTHIVNSTAQTPQESPVLPRRSSGRRFPISQSASVSWSGATSTRN